MRYTILEREAVVESSDDTDGAEEDNQEDEWNDWYTYETQVEEPDTQSHGGNTGDQHTAEPDAEDEPTPPNDGHYTYIDDSWAQQEEEVSMLSPGDRYRYDDGQGEWTTDMDTGKSVFRKYARGFGQAYEIPDEGAQIPDVYASACTRNQHEVLALDALPEPESEVYEERGQPSGSGGATS